jgi:protein-S-isoprenylcysteine O-methyltransferase Ste14
MSNLPELHDPKDLAVAERHLRQQIDNLPPQFAPIVPILVVMVGLLLMIYKLLTELVGRGAPLWQTIALGFLFAVLGAILGVIFAKYLGALLP